MAQSITKTSKHKLAITLALICIFSAIAGFFSSPLSKFFTSNDVQKTNTESKNSQTPSKEHSLSIPPHSMVVGLYGSPDTPALGVLGENELAVSAEKIIDIAKKYSKLSTKTVIPAFEIITTIASASPTENNDYSSELPIQKIKQWVDVARVKNIYVILDLQPGLSSFTDQAKLYESLLREPHVGLALDPEWRLKPHQKHMKQIGTVDASEINETALWLNKLIENHNLPKKILLIHQFKPSMITNRHILKSDLKNISWIIQMDGLGSQSAKLGSWNVIKKNLPSNINLGWKNFIDEDNPMLSPEQTMLINPIPSYVSYQ